MTPDEAAVAVGVAEMISRELDEDYVGLWKVAWHLRQSLGSVSDQQVRELAAVILHGLLSSGLSVGELSEESGEFNAWSGPAGIEHAMSEWASLGRDPNMGEIAWLVRQR
jgi:hypothetical protein